MVPLPVDGVGEPARGQLAVPAIAPLEERDEDSAVVRLEEPSEGPPANVLPGPGAVQSRAEPAEGRQVHLGGYSVVS